MVLDLPATPEPAAPAEAGERPLQPYVGGSAADPIDERLSVCNRQTNIKAPEASATDPIPVLVPPERRDTLMAKPDPMNPNIYRFDIRVQGGADETVFFDA